MTNSQPLNITPGMGVYGYFKHINYKSWFAIAEFIDNAIQSFETKNGTFDTREKCLINIQYDPNNSYLSVEDNILLMGLSAHKELKRYLEILSLKDLLDIKVANLSYGQQKKLALLRIFLSNSDLIVLDEPFVGLDIENQNILTDFLKNQLQNEKGIIFTSHIHCSINSNILEID